MTLPTPCRSIPHKPLEILQGQGHHFHLGHEILRAVNLTGQSPIGRVYVRALQSVHASGPALFLWPAVIAGRSQPRPCGRWPRQHAESARPGCSRSNPAVLTVVVTDASPAVQAHQNLCQAEKVVNIGAALGTFAVACLRAC